MRSPTRWLARRRQPLRVACASGEGYLPHCATMLHSLIVTQPRPVQVHLLAPAELTPESEERLSSWVESLGAGIDVHRIDERDPQLRGVPRHFSISSWYRLLLPRLLPNHDRILYLDSDIIVMDSLDPLLHIDLSGKCLAAVTNPPITVEWMAKHSAALGLPEPDDYFNAGVMLMNLEGLRAGGWADRVIDFALVNTDPLRASEVDENSPRDVFVYTMKHPERLLFPDQDALNAVLHEHRLKLHPRWNVQTLFWRSEVRTADLTEQRVAEARTDPAIRHFEGPGHSKPWHPDAEPEDSARYWLHRDQTPWAR
jgi:lipopolysaccharide biosynthesis glycosyltransferase